MFILQGPEDDEEPESDLSVTELKQQRQERLAAAEAERARAEAEEEERVKKEAERGIDWGMGRYNIAIIDGTTSSNSFLYSRPSFCKDNLCSG